MTYMEHSTNGEMSELAEGARLEIVYTPKAYLGFESPSLRQEFQSAGITGAFFASGSF